MPNPTTAKKSRLTAIQPKPDANTRIGIPVMPNTLPSSYRAEWRALVSHMRENEIWVPQKAGLVEAFLMNLSAVREAEAYMQAHGVIMADGKQNPASAVLVRHTATLNKLAEQLALGKCKVAPNAPIKPAATKASTWSA